jgi:hypothetical protein
VKDWTPIILAILALAGGGGGLYSALTVGATRRKMVAEAAQVQANTTTVLGGFAVDVLLKPLRERIQELEEEVEGLRQRVRQAYEAQEEIERLRALIRRYEDEIVQLKRTVAALTGAAPVVVDPSAPSPAPGPERQQPNEGA